MYPSRRLQSLTDRINRQARAQATDPNRLRRQVAFHRLAARLARSGWVLKGGYCVEIRLPGRARTTRDMDVATRLPITSADSLRDDLEALLDVDLGDGFDFRVASVRSMRPEGMAGTAWRVKFDAMVEGHRFEGVVLDVVEQAADLAEATEPLDVAAPVEGVGHDPVRIEAVDVYQHAAEKYHAMGRIYSGGRVSSRVKDLVDLVLFIESGLLTDHRRLGDRLAAVHRARGLEPPAAELPEPPADWAPRYAHLVEGLGVSARAVDEAFPPVAAFYAAAVAGRTQT